MLITSRYSTGVPNRTFELTEASTGGLLIKYYVLSTVIVDEKSCHLKRPGMYEHS